MPTAPERREQILQAAERLFRHYGPAKTTISDIAREVGIGVGSVYLEFCSKAAIVTELADQRHRQILEAMRSAGKRHAAAEGLCAALEARIDVLFDWAEQGAHACDFVACAGPAGFPSEERQLLGELLQRGRTAAELEFEDIVDVLAALETAYVGLSPPALFRLPRAEALRRTRQLNRLLLNGLAVRLH